MIRSRRTAFSLIELLVVIALMSVLAALSAGTYFRIRSSQVLKATEAELSKLNTGLDRIVGAARDQADKEFTTGQLIGNTQMSTLQGFAGANQTARARAIWIYFRLKNEFPQTFPEALAYTTLLGAPTSSYPSGAPILSLPPKQTFRNVLNVAPAATGTQSAADVANLQAAALLYLILSEKGSRGEVFDVESLKAHVVEVPISGGTFRVFMDSWGTPITYVRFLSSPDINELPYARNSGAANFSNPSSLPVALSNSYIDTQATFTAAGWPTTNNISNFTYFCTSAGIVTNPNTPQMQEQLLRYNFIPCVVSAGPGKVWSVNTAGPFFDVRGVTPATPAGIVQYDPSLDGTLSLLFGYRLRQFGGKSD